MAKAFFVGFNLADKISRFVVGIPVKSVKKYISTDQTSGKFCHKLCGCRGFASDNGAHVRLTDTDYPVLNTIAAVFIHPQLLAIQFMDDQEVAVLTPG